MGNFFKKHSPFIMLVAKVAAVSFTYGLVGTLAYNYAIKDGQAE